MTIPLNTRACVMLQKQFINTCYIHVMYQNISNFIRDKLCPSCVIIGYDNKG